MGYEVSEDILEGGVVIGEVLEDSDDVVGFRGFILRIEGFARRGIYLAKYSGISICSLLLGVVQALFGRLRAIDPALVIL